MIGTADPCAALSSAAAQATERLGLAEEWRQNPVLRAVLASLALAFVIAAAGWFGALPFSGHSSGAWVLSLPDENGGLVWQASRWGGLIHLPPAPLQRL